MTVCCLHKDFFDDSCTECRKEYSELKGLREINNNDVDNGNNTTRQYKSANTSSSAKVDNKKIQQQQQQELSKYYKEFTEERAKRLYEDLLLQFVRSGKYNEIDASHKARSIIRKQCSLRNMPFWPWI
ncbi:MAG TPA: hypothetical protein VJ729_12595 [Nitrososphaeraceae archaeon]|nr:hypothetical protein [Nitrososphaeraceae archaeon]